MPKKPTSTPRSSVTPPSPTTRSMAAASKKKGGTPTKKVSPAKRKSTAGSSGAAKPSSSTVIKAKPQVVKRKGGVASSLGIAAVKGKAAGAGKRGGGGVGSRSEIQALREYLLSLVDDSYNDLKKNGPTIMTSFTEQLDRKYKQLVRDAKAAQQKYVSQVREQTAERRQQWEQVLTHMELALTNVSKKGTSGHKRLDEILGSKTKNYKAALDKAISAAKTR